MTTMQSAQGLDVSNWNSPAGTAYDWKAAKARIPNLMFGIYRLTQGLGLPGQGSPDATARANHDAIKAEGLAHGAYHFLDPFEHGEPQAEYFVSEHEKIGLDLLDMLWLDNETKGASPAATAACADAFMRELVKLRPHNPHGVYTYIDFAREGYCSGLGSYDLWLAYPNLTAPAEPPPWMGPRFKFWQWGARNGIDADAFMGDDAAFIAWLHSFLPQHPSAWRKVLTEPASLSSIAAHRNTTPGHLWAMLTQHATEADVKAIAATELQPGFVLYTTRPW